MTPERWDRIKEIFTAVSELPGERRKSALTVVCRGDLELQVELEQLLDHHDRMGSFLSGEPSTSGGLAPGFVLADRYRIVSLLGSGGMGEVYEAQDVELGERIALKVIHQEASWQDNAFDSLRREVQLARRITHPNVCRVYDIGRHREHGREIVFLTMELIRGETLSVRLKREGRLSPNETPTIAGQLCAAMGAAHQAGILHRDFKPGNVMLIGSEQEVRAVITDFGVARWIRSARDGVLTSAISGNIRGTPAYMSPEQIQGKDLTPASDIYSLGLVLYEMLTGVRPFSDASPWTEAMKRLSEEPTPPIRIAPDIGKSWNRAVLMCLDRDSSSRVSSSEVLMTLLSGNSRSFSVNLRNRGWIAGAAFVVVMLASWAAVDRIGRPPLPAGKHIAVLPFRFAGGSPEDQATADDLANSLSDNLAPLSNSTADFWVAPWETVRKRLPNDEQHAGSTLGVNLLLTGELERQGGGMMIHLHIKDAKTLKELRREQFAIPASQVVSTEDALLDRASGILEVQLPSGVLHHLPVDGTVEPGAYEFYQQGNGYLSHFEGRDLDKAILLFQRSLEKDSRFAPAHAGLAEAFVRKFSETKDSSWLQKARQECGRALSLNENLALAYLTQGRIDFFAGNFNGAIQSLEKAVALSPGNEEAQNNLAMVYDRAGQLLRAESLLKEVLRRNRANWVTYDFLAAFYYRHQQYNQAELLFRTAMDLAPDNSVAFSNLAAIYMSEGRCAEAESLLIHAVGALPNPGAGAWSNLGTAKFCIEKYGESAALFRKAIQLRPADHRLWRNLGDALTRAGDTTGARDAYRTAVEMAQRVLAVDPQDGVLLGNIALYYAKLGEPEKASRSLAKAQRFQAQNQDFVLLTAEVFEAMGKRERAIAVIRGLLQKGYSQDEIRNDFEFAQLRKDPRYAAMVADRGSASKLAAE